MKKGVLLFSAILSAQSMLNEVQESKNGVDSTVQRQNQIDKKMFNRFYALALTEILATKNVALVPSAQAIEIVLTVADTPFEMKAEVQRGLLEGRNQNFIDQVVAAQLCRLHITSLEESLAMINATTKLNAAKIAEAQLRR